MAVARKLILHSPLKNEALLVGFVKQCLAERVSLLAIVGPDSARLEDEIDWIVIGDGTDAERFLCTTSHSGETLEDVVEMAELWEGEGVVEHVFL